MTDKELFIENLKNRTKKFAVDIIALCDTLKDSKALSVITYQLIKSSSSAGANYRAASRARSKQDFFSKIVVVVENADESEYWLELINDANLSNEKVLLTNLLNEAKEISKIMTKVKNSTYNK